MKKSLWISILFLIFQSCDENLDQEPRQELATELVFVNEANLRSALVGAYSAIKGTFLDSEGGELYGGDFNMISELLASNGNVLFAGSFSTYREVQQKAMFSTNTLIRNNWIRAYDAINTVNNVLANLDLAESASAREDIHGQAKCIRGMIYFELVRFWCRPFGTGNEATDPGVPLVLEPVLTVEDAEATGTLGRSTVSAVYDQVISDLLDAKDLLPANSRNGTDLSTYAASAVLARVYLQQGDYDLAAIEADRVIGDSLYSLTGTPLAAFNNTANTTEDIFAIQQTTLSNAGVSNSGLSTFYASLNGAGRGDMQIARVFIESFEPGDLRGGLQRGLSENATITNVNEMYYVGVGERSGNNMCAKWGNGELNIPVIRLAEVILTRAEANFEAGTTIGATPVEDINVIRNRAGLPALGTVTLGDIRNERVRELAFEGFLIHDVKRWQVTVGSLTYDADELVLPIPERELEVYDIPQNPGYN